jgi:hypothetical protein
VSNADYVSELDDLRRSASLMLTPMVEGVLNDVSSW